MGDFYFPVLFTAGSVFLLLFLIGFIGMKVRFPGVVLYIITGIVLGGMLSGNELLHLAGEIGIVLLFFMLGMEFSISRLVAIAGKVAPAGTLDVILNLVLTTGICMLFGLDWITAFLIGGVIYATSSSITAKILESTKRMANPESEFMLALLIFEDLVAPVAVAVLVGLTAGVTVTAFSIGMIILKIVLLIIGAVFIGHFVFRKLGNFVDKYISEDIFILLVVGMAITYGGLALMLDLSEVLGAFLAGIILAESRRTESLAHAVRPVRDLLLPLFFLYFGTTITFGDGGVPMIPMLITLLVWSVAAKLIVGFFGGQMYGLSKKVAFRAGISLTQRGEFSVIIASLATTDVIRLFCGIFILASAMIGIFLFQMAPKMTNMIFPKKHRPLKYEVPGE